MFEIVTFLLDHFFLQHLLVRGLGHRVIEHIVHFALHVGVIFVDYVQIVSEVVDNKVIFDLITKTQILVHLFIDLFLQHQIGMLVLEQKALTLLDFLFSL